MRATRRRDELLRIVRHDGYVSVTGAARALGVDTSTVRRDLSALDRLGLIQRSHGGALPVRYEPDIPRDVRMTSLVPEKRAIAQMIAADIPQRAAVMLDAGTTALMVARALQNHAELTVLTPDVHVAAELIMRPGMRVIMTGGENVPGTATVISHEAVETIRRHHVNIAVIGADGIEPTGVSVRNGTVIPLKYAMMDTTDRTVLAMDSSKFGQRNFARVADVDAFDEIVTDDRLDEAVLGDYPIPIRRATVANESIPDLTRGNGVSNSG